MSHLPASELCGLLWVVPFWLVVSSVLTRAPGDATDVQALDVPETDPVSEELEVLLLAAAGRLWRKVSHEANNSLSSIMGNSEVGLISKQPERMARGLEASGRAARELRQLFVSLSDLSARTGEVTMTKENIRDVLRPVTTLLQRSLEKAGISLAEPDGDLPVAYCDRQKMSIALAALTARLLDELRPAGGGEMRLSAVEANGTIKIGIEARQAHPAGGTFSAVVDPAGIEERLAAAVCRLHGGDLGIERERDATRYLLRIEGPPQA